MDKIKILMVDDDKMLIDLYKERLELAGYQVEVSRDGEEGLAKVHQVKPDLVLLDIMMPKVNGYEALASIKSDPGTKDTPVIILSALMRDINKSKAIESGADDYIIKSEAMPADVIKKIESVLKKYHKSAPAAVVEPKEEAKKEEPEKESEVPEPAAPATPRETTFTTTQAPSPQEKPAVPEIEFEPAPGGQDIHPGEVAKTPPIAQAVPTDNAVPPSASAVPQAPATSQPTSSTKASPVVVFFLVLIVILIIASDFYFYMKTFLTK